MAAYERLLRPLLFRLDPERVHHWALALIARGLIKGKLLQDSRLEVEAFGVRFPNPIGLAAGFDKDAKCAARWHGLGFGFAELGTITRTAQAGNPRPRLFRLPEDRALINRMGFNNEGAEVVARRLRDVRSQIPLGVNLGKSKATPLEDAVGDYVASATNFSGLGDYLAVNVSSPNTPGLRVLQEKAALSSILDGIRSVDPGRPILVKIAPDLSHAQLDEVIEVAVTSGCQGIIATNTTIARPSLQSQIVQEGGLSGMPLRPLADQVLGYLGKHAPPELTLIGAGGTFSAEDVRAKMDLGAKLVQIYTGFVYGGPTIVPKLLLGLLGSSGK